MLKPTQRSIGLVDASSQLTHGGSKKQVTEISSEPFVERLFRNEKKHKAERTADDALLSTLPSDTLKFLKARRKKESFEKVPLTYYRERQLRAVFRGLDFDGMGTIHLELVKDAADYAEEKLKPKRGPPVFVNVRGMFEAMDEDGDGTVDFHEFTIAMTGSSSSAIDSASEHDVENLTSRFLEFANIKKRERAVQMIQDNIPLSEMEAPTMDDLRNREGRMSPGAKMLAADIPALDISQKAYDLDKLDQFRTCFSVFNKNVKSEEVIAEAKERMSPSKKIASSPSRVEGGGIDDKADIDVGVPDFTQEVLKTQELLEWHYGETKGFQYNASSGRYSGEEEDKAQEEFEGIQKRAKERRMKEAQSAQKDIEIIESRRRELAEQKYITSFDRKKTVTLSERARRKKMPPLMPKEATPVRNGIKMQIQARQEIKDLKDALQKSGRRGSETSMASSNSSNSKNSRAMVNSSSRGSRK